MRKVFFTLVLLLVLAPVVGFCGGKGGAALVPMIYPICTDAEIAAGTSATPCIPNPRGTALAYSGASAEVLDEAVGAGGEDNATHAYSMNSIYNWGVLFDPLLNGSVNAVTLGGQGINYFEPSLGNPGDDYYVLSSTATGTRSWMLITKPMINFGISTDSQIDAADIPTTDAGGHTSTDNVEFAIDSLWAAIPDLASPGTIGGTTPGIGNFSSVTIGSAKLTRPCLASEPSSPSEQDEPVCADGDNWQPGGDDQGTDDWLVRYCSTCGDESSPAWVGIYNLTDGAVLQQSSGGGGTWGSITGTLSDQSDLQSAIDAKWGTGDDLGTGVVAQSPSNYTPTSSTINGHLAGIDAQLAVLYAQLSAAGLNSWNFTPDTPASYPYYFDTDSPVLDFSVVDSSSTYDTASVAYQINSGGYSGNAMADQGSNIWRASLSSLSDASYTFQMQASDDKSTPNTQESSEYTFVVDTTDPVLVAGTDDTYDGTGNVQGSVALTETNYQAPTYTAVGSTSGTLGSGTCTGTYPNYATGNIDMTGLTETLTFTYAAYDLADNQATGTDLTQVFTYSAPAGTADILLHLNFENTMVADKGSITGSNSGMEFDDSTYKVGAYSLNHSSNYANATFTISSSHFVKENNIVGFWYYNENGYQSGSNNFIYRITDGVNDYVFVQMHSSGGVKVTWSGNGSTSVAEYTASSLSTATWYYIVVSGEPGAAGNDLILTIYDEAGSTVGTGTAASITAMTDDPTSLIFGNSSGDAVRWRVDNFIMGNDPTRDMWTVRNETSF